MSSRCVIYYGRNEKGTAVQGGALLSPAESSRAPGVLLRRGGEESVCRVADARGVFLRRESDRMVRDVQRLEETTKCTVKENESTVLFVGCGYGLCPRRICCGGRGAAGRIALGEVQPGEAIKKTVVVSKDRDQERSTFRLRRLFTDRGRLLFTFTFISHSTGMWSNQWRRAPSEYVQVQIPTLRIWARINDIFTATYSLGSDPRRQKQPIAFRVCRRHQR